MFSHKAWRRGKLAATGLLLTTSLILTACGGSSDDGGSDTAAPSGSSDTSAEVAKAEALVKEYSTPPTGIGVDTPLTSAPAKGKTFVWMQCEAPQCSIITTFMKEAIAAVGWNLKVLNFEAANPATLVSGLKQALQEKPVAVGFVALPYAVWQGVIPDYEKAGVALIPQNVGEVPLSATVPANIGGPDATAKGAEILAQWFIADSKGKGKALLFSTPEIGTSTVYRDAFVKTVEAGCAECEVKDLKLPYADVVAGKASSSIISSLQQDPAIKYVISHNQVSTAGTPEALKAAGLTDVKLAGGSAQKAEEAAVNSGQLAAVTPTSLNFTTWLVVDAALRFSLGMEQPKDVQINKMLITKASNVTPSDSFDYPADWEEQFKTLWKVS
ncbi:sugar ABC transporter substrate-binding protein [Gordonia sp. DT30]|uniref:sugar ABC transporter substrate-binding protein n=1 Tax=Gordonia sp. DT30 TaxID=3416546 RepID=UPI003CEEF54B